MLGVFVSLMPAPSTLKAWVIWPLFLILNVTLPVLLTEGLAGSILNSVSERLTVLPPPPEVEGVLFVEELPLPLLLLLLLLSLLLLPHPATAKAPAARTAIES